MAAEYAVIKSAIQQAFVDNGATLSHHHAVGTEHAQWLEQDISAPGVAMLEALFDGDRPGPAPEPRQDRLTGLLADRHPRHEPVADCEREVARAVEPTAADLAAIVVVAAVRRRRR